MTYLLTALLSAAAGYAVAVLTLSWHASDQAALYRSEQAELDAQRRELRDLHGMGKRQ